MNIGQLQEKCDTFLSNFCTSLPINKKKKVLKNIQIEPKIRTFLQFIRKIIMMVEKAEGFLFRKPVYQYFQYLET